MEEIICTIILGLTIVLFLAIFRINIKKAKEIQENKTLEKITDKFPENIEIAKEMLEMLENRNVRIEEAKNTNTSLYIVITNKISIADMKNNYARIQTIAHECLHSCQEKVLLLFNFIFSNINLIYFYLISALTIIKIAKPSILQTTILMIFLLIQFTVRSFLETDAMTRSRFLAKEYIEKKNLCSKEEQNKLLEQYKKINEIGIPFTIVNLLISGLFKVLIYSCICIIM